MLRRVLLPLLFITPTIAHANVTITEVMYDLEGSDTKREWVEIWNFGDSDVLISDWRFNDGSNHVLTPPPGSGESITISPNEGVILASDRDTFLSEHSVSGMVIDTVMSLSNEGEAVSLIDENGVVVDTFSYTKDMGAGGNGNSLSRVGESIVEGVPTPFRVTDNMPENQDDPGNDPGEEHTSEDTEKAQPAGSPPVPRSIWADAGSGIQGVAGGLILFEGTAYGLENKPLEDARYEWNFGDGSTGAGQHVAHTYLYPGTYSANLTVSSGAYADTDRFAVEIGEANVAITYADRGKIEITNRSSDELDLSYWSIQYKKNIFLLPKGTFIGGEMTGIFPAAVTGIVVGSLEDLSLLYPNGVIAVTYLVPIPQKPAEEEPRKQVTVPQIQSSAPVSAKADTEPALQNEYIDPAAEERTFQGAASVVLSEDASHTRLYPWLIAVVGILCVAGFFVLSREDLFRRRSGEKELRAKDFQVSE